MGRMFTTVGLVVAFCMAAGLSFAGDNVVQIGISQIVEHPALDATRKGFMDYLAKNGYPEGKRVVYDYKNAQNNRAVSGQIARKLVGLFWSQENVGGKAQEAKAGEKKGLILTISTPSSQDVAALTKEIPILFAAVTDPVAAGLVKSLDKPGANISGTTDKSPISRQLDVILKIVPSAKTIGTVYNAGEANSVVSVKDLKAAAAKRKLSVVEASAASTSAVKMATESLVGKVDVIHITTDNTVVQALESVVKVCIDNKIPLFAADTDSVARGAIAALAVDYYKLGVQTGAMAKKILDGVAKVGDLPVEYQKELLLHLNPGSAAKMGVKLPESMVKQAAKIIK